MKIPASIRRSLAATLLAAGLAYPACAAVCPKGIGNCTSPGRCFLFTDADGNSLCDYTAGSDSSARSSPVQVQQPVAQPTATPTGIQATNVQAVSDTAAVQSTGTSSVPQAFPFAAILAGIFFFIALTGILYTSVRKGILGIRIDQPAPAVAFSALVSLGLSLMATSILSGEAIQGMVFALAYLVTGTVLTAYLWLAGVMSRRIILVLAAVSTLAGFIFVAPIMPLEFIGIICTLAGISSITPAIIILCAIIALAAVIGRTFCGHICPVGSLQELAYAVPVKKMVIRNIRTLELIRLGAFVAAIFAAIYLVDLMKYTGLYALFSLAVSATMAVGAAVILLSVFIYRPVCRAICPFGVLFSLFAQFSWFRIRRNESCIACKKCEKSCPARCAGKDDAKRECYLCGRCTAACPVAGALKYTD